MCEVADFRRKVDENSLFQFIAQRRLVVYRRFRVTMSKKTAGSPLTGQPPLGLTPHFSWQLVYGICFTRRGVWLQIWCCCFYRAIQTHLKSALHCTMPRVQCRLHFTPYASVNGTRLLARPYCLTATKLKPLLVRLCVHLDCDQCGRPVFCSADGRPSAFVTITDRTSR